ncbi:MAG: PIN domain-containing protein [Candidatus Manganitrophaceae bacterium]
MFDKEFLSLFSAGFHLHFTGKTPFLRIVKSDPDDDKFIECAVALKAQVIITGDRALRSVGAYMGIRIVTPEPFLDDFRKGR